MSASISTPLNDQKIATWIVPASAAVGGAFGAGVCFPFEALKKKTQSGQPLTWQPTELYRGCSPFMVSVMTAAIASITFNHAIKDKMPEAHAAVASGMLGAIVGSTPVENIILTQQLNKMGPLEAWVKMWRQGPTRPWLALPELMGREAGFAGIMLHFGPMAYKRAYEQTGDATVAKTAQIGISIVGAALTQPFDTLATKKQVENGARSTGQIVQDIWKQRGLKGFVQGLPQRAVLFTGCALLIPQGEQTTRERLTNLQAFLNKEE